MEPRIVLSEFTKVGIARFTELCQNLLIALTGNAYFPTPTPSLAVFETALEQLVQLTGQAESGDRTKINLRDDQREVVMNLVYELANYILFTANGDVTKIESTTLKIAKSPVRRGIPQPVTGLRVSVSPAPGSGKVALKWKSEKGVTYVVEATTGDPTNPQTAWDPCMFSTKASCTVEGLNTNVYWSFRVICVNAAGMSQPSAVVTALVA